MSYKEVFLDLETTGLDPMKDEVLQISIIDESGTVLINEYCKPKNVQNWDDAARINGITSEMVNDKQHFKYYKDKISEILLNSEKIVIYNVDFDYNFLLINDIKCLNKGEVIGDKLFCMMESFAETYGDWNEYYNSYKWQNLSTCALWYGYDLKTAHDSLEDVRATRYCYYRHLTDNSRYTASEFIGKTIDEFADTILVDDKEIILEIQCMRGYSIYFRGKIKSKDQIKYIDLLGLNIKVINFVNFSHYVLYTEKCLSRELEIKEQIIKRILREQDKLQEINLELNKKIELLQKENHKYKKDLGLIEKPKKVKIEKFNQYGFYTADYCRTTNKVMFKDSNEYGPFSDKFLSESRCKKIKQPVKQGEEIKAFYRVQNGYCALYLRDLK